MIKKSHLYGREFDASNQHWTPRPKDNELFLRVQENWANDRLNALGHLFLNEVYDSLGFPRSQSGAIVGWFKEPGSNPVKFEIVAEIPEEGWMLDFNVDGVMYNKLPLF